LLRRKPKSVAAPAAASAPTPFDPQLLHGLTSAEFELLIAELHRRDGYEIELPLALGTDEDIDLIVERDPERMLVQCKHWKSQKVGAAAVRGFHEALKVSGARRGLLVTTGEFSREAVDYVTGRPLKLINGKTLGRLVQKHQRPGEALHQTSEWMDEFVAAAHWIEPRCPSCGAPMTLRKSVEAAQRLWLCTTAPKCEGKRSARRELLDRMPVTRPERQRDSAVIDV
jgi:restriction system protein